MRDSEIEYWVLRLADQVREHKPVEDNRAELKADWPEPDFKMARRIAAIANAARLEPVLFVIGLDEKSGLAKSPSTREVSSWWAKVQKCFNGTPPELHVLNVTVGNEVVVGLLFHTTRAPFVVTVPNGSPIDRDVPWREGNATRSAAREDLLRMLVPVIRAPRIDILSGSLDLIEPQSSDAYWRLEVQMYITPQSRDVLFFPNHTGRASIRWTGREVALADLSFAGIGGAGNIDKLNSELAVRGPGAAVLIGTAKTPRNLLGSAVSVEFRISYEATDGYELVLNGMLTPSTPKPNTNVAALWTYAPT